MRCLSFITALIILSGVHLYAQTRHGESLEYDCSNCHQSTTWEVVKDKMNFNHKDTGFELIGQHKLVNCRFCHESLVFEEASADCFSCHKDIHRNTAGFDCSQCHTPESWIVKDINGIHQLSRFPLAGAHQLSDCKQCHSGYENLTFEPLGITCYECHQKDYAATASPNHAQAGFSTDCKECHSITELNWAVGIFNHDFFPLTGGHQIANCFSCHQQGGSFTGLSPVCYSCHQQDYESVTDPSHLTGNFSKDCLECHTINKWTPSTFDHNLTRFPLTGAHINTSCISCHSEVFTNTPMECQECHLDDYNESVNPNHTALAIPTDCQTCHTAEPNWEPASFPDHNNYYELIGAHAVIADNCSACHNGDYNNTPNTCFGCHESDYNGTTNPPHSSVGFGPDCQNCHTQNAWTPATFDHDNQFFPIYTGKHAGEWNVCSDCHTNPQNYSIFSCIDCHEHNQPEMDQKHGGIAGYVYSSEACYACHPEGTAAGAFTHAISNFPLTGAHISLACQQCHSAGYSGTPTECVACHQAAYTASTNPSHTALAIPATCQDCHTTNPNWEPAAFPVHDNYYALVGAHSAIANQCFTCHQGNYNSTPNTCYGCHDDDYINTSNPNHQAAGFPIICENCHTQNAWTPATFDHDNLYFPIYSGRHQGRWNLCSDCHSDPGNFSIFTCTTACHPQGEMNIEHQGVSGYVYLSSACLSCHPDGDNKFRTPNLEHD